MNNERINESDQSGSEPERPNLDSLFDALELDAELNSVIYEIRTALLDPKFDKNRLRRLWLEHALISERYVEQFLDPIEYTRAQLVVILHKAFIFRDVDDMPRFLEELYIAEEYAYNTGFEDIRQKISNQIDLVTG